MIQWMPRRLLPTLILLAALIPVASCNVTKIEVEPTEPMQGDTVTLRIKASPEESIPITITFTKTLPVSNGEYDLPLNGVNVPQTPNSFTVETEGVLNLNVAVKVLIWFTKSADASSGVATVSQGGVPPGAYTARIYGQAAPGVTSVKLSVTASTTVTMGPDGRYAFSYDTEAISAGDFTAKIGDATRSITLKPTGGQEAVAPTITQKPTGGQEAVSPKVAEKEATTAENEATIKTMVPIESSLLTYVAGGIFALAALTIRVLLRRKPTRGHDAR